jgi:hypothetical protein
VNAKRRKDPDGRSVTVPEGSPSPILKVSSVGEGVICSIEVGLATVLVAVVGRFGFSDEAGELCSVWEVLLGRVMLSTLELCTSSVLGELVSLLASGLGPNTDVVPALLPFGLDELSEAAERVST